jgi:hypothetical protein
LVHYLISIFNLYLLSGDAKVVLTGNQGTLYLIYDSDDTLFKCTNKIEYFSTNGSWVQIPSKIVSTDEGSTYYLTEFQPSNDMKFKYFGQDMTFIEFNDSSDFQNLKITSYGYRLNYLP